MSSVCLIIPPSIFLLDERVFMSLGILRVAAVLEQEGYAAEVLDLSGVENYEEVMRIHASGSDAKVFGITGTTPQMPAAGRIVAAIRAVRPDARIVLGGPHVTLVNAARKREISEGTPGRAMVAFRRLEETFDVLVAGDGEFGMRHVLENENCTLVDADDTRSPLFLTNRTLDSLPFPARHLVDVESYRYGIEGERALSLIAQLGCPFQCGFCGGRESPMLRRIRTRSSGNIIAEIRQMHEAYGVKGFMFYDDELNVNPRMVDLMDAITGLQKELGVAFRLRGFIKSQLFTDAQAEAMRRAGFRWILTGFESGAPRILTNINKQATLEENDRCVVFARRHGLKVKALMSIGHPGETKETLRQTLDWLLRIRPDDFDVTIITTYPGTPYYDRAVPSPDRPGEWVYRYKKTGDRLYQKEVDYMEVADYYKGRPEGGYRSYVWTDELSPDELVEGRDTIERTVRERLGIPYPSAAAPARFEHSMGQFGPLPPHILRRSSLRVARSGPPDG